MKYTTTMKGNETMDEFVARGGVVFEEGDTAEEFIKKGKTPEEIEFRRAFVERESSPEELMKRDKAISSNVLYKELDVDVVPVIKELNAKGYKTTACCAGHGFGKHGYIAFKNVNGGKFTNEQEREISRIFAKLGVYEVVFDESDWQDAIHGEAFIEFPAMSKARNINTIRKVGLNRGSSKDRSKRKCNKGNNKYARIVSGIRGDEFK
jgi:hypothetical protein